jgi:PKD repeat protein
MAKHEVDFGAMGSGFGVLTYRWNFGDGSEGSAGVVAKHVYSMPGDYVVTLRVTDELMHQESISRTISVQPAIQ